MTISVPTTPGIESRHCVFNRPDDDHRAPRVCSPGLKISRIYFKLIAIANSPVPLRSECPKETSRETQLCTLAVTYVYQP